MVNSAVCIYERCIMIKSVHPALYVAHRRYPGSRLGPGCLAAHKGSHLVLLHSCPDTVHETLLRKTQTSTLLTRGSPAKPASEAGYHPCWSGLQVQGTAISPAARKLSDLIFAARLSIGGLCMLKYTCRDRVCQGEIVFSRSAAFPAALARRRALKKSFSSAEHSSPKSPVSVST